jgi:hypothetical protein
MMHSESQIIGYSVEWLDNELEIMWKETKFEVLIQNLRGGTEPGEKPQS